MNISGGENNSVQGATKLSDLKDVYISGLSNGHALVYSSINNKWINSDISSKISGEYLTIDDAAKMYVPVTGGTVDWLQVKGLTNVGGNLLVTGGITMYNS